MAAFGRKVKVEAPSPVVPVPVVAPTPVVAAPVVADKGFVLLVIGTNRTSWNGTPVSWVPKISEPFTSRWGDMGEDDEVEDHLFKKMVAAGAKRIEACWTKPHGWTPPAPDKQDEFCWELRARAV